MGDVVTGSVEELLEVVRRASGLLDSIERDAFREAAVVLSSSGHARLSGVVLSFGAAVDLARNALAEAVPAPSGQEARVTGRADPLPSGTS